MRLLTCTRNVVYDSGSKRVADVGVVTYMRRKAARSSNSNASFAFGTGVARRRATRATQVTQKPHDLKAEARGRSRAISKSSCSFALPCTKTIESNSSTIDIDDIFLCRYVDFYSYAMTPSGGCRVLQSALEEAISCTLSIRSANARRADCGHFPKR